MNRFGNTMSKRPFIMLKSNSSTKMGISTEEKPGQYALRCVIVEKEIQQKSLLVCLTK